MRVAVIGGGLAGLAAAHEIAADADDVTVLESSDRLGGQVHTERDDRFVVEHGAEGFVASSAATRGLCERLGIAGNLVPQVQSRSLALRNGALEEIGADEAAAFLGFEIMPTNRTRGIVTLRQGMGQLVHTLADAVARRAEVRLQTGAVGLEPEEESWRIRVSGGVTLVTDAVIVAIPPSRAAKLLAPFARDAAVALRRIPVVSTLTVTLAYAPDSISHALDASGFVGGQDGREPGGLRACVFTSSKFPGRAPRKWTLLRAFFRPDSHSFRELSDDGWSQHAHRLLAPVIGISAEPRASWTSRWPAALPQYGRDHALTVDAVSQQLRNFGNIELAGAAYEGRGIDGAVRSGQQAARTLVRQAPPK